MKIETKAFRVGRHLDQATGAETPPIHLSSTFERQPDGSYPTGFEYSRDGRFLDRGPGAERLRVVNS